MSSDLQPGDPVRICFDGLAPSKYNNGLAWNATLGRRVYRVRAIVPVYGETTPAFITVPDHKSGAPVRVDKWVRVASIRSSGGPWK